MSHFHKHPSGERISGQTVVVNGNSIVIGVWGSVDFSGQPLFVANEGDDLMIAQSGSAGDSSLWTVTVKPSARKKSVVRDKLFANTVKWETWDTVQLEFHPVAEVALKLNVSRMAPPNGRANHVGGDAYSPVEASLTHDKVFEWTTVSGSGSVQYFQIFEDVVPNWFGVVVPDGVTAPRDVLLFFHPTPGQAGYDDKAYKSKAGWDGIFHYMTDLMAKQFCAAKTGQILVMPLMTNSSAGSCGILPRNWEKIFSQILGLVTAGSNSSTAPPVSVGSLVVASFSAGIAYSASFRAGSGAGGRVKKVIDFDGIISSSKAASKQLHSGNSVRFHQGSAPEHSLPMLASQNYFPMGSERWGPPFSSGLGTMDVHGYIPHTMMFIGAQRAIR
ncbi:MAG TPA: hypothetical protein VFB63_07080 [Bryobacteraceae bacterium]|nr:hypothetical protein [Bryobacteraceae bacterium]